MKNPLGIGDPVRVDIDRPCSFEGELNRGIAHPLSGGSGEGVASYVLEIQEPARETIGTVIAVIHKRDGEQAVVVSRSRRRYSVEEIRTLLSFDKTCDECEISL